VLDLEQLWPDPDRRDEALERLAGRIGRQPDEALTPEQARTLELLSHGVGVKGTAELTHYSISTIASHVRAARRILQAKDTTHAVANALRAGIIS
jgi:DNA-binding NarL/FixJ family response regulator